MKTSSFCEAITAIFLAISPSLLASEILTIDFEDLSDSAQHTLTNQIQGLVFEDVTVMTPATVRSSTDGDLSAAVSGRQRSASRRQSL